jgi:hypothetical protein
MTPWLQWASMLPVFIVPWVFQVMAIVTALVIWERFFRIRR